MQSRNLVHLHIDRATPRRNDPPFITSKRITLLGFFMFGILGILSL
jgi:hypothetical protein